MGWQSFDVVRFDLGPLLQGQTRIAKLKSAYNLLLVLEAIMAYISLVIGRRGFKCEDNL